MKAWESELSLFYTKIYLPSKEVNLQSIVVSLDLHTIRNAFTHFFLLNKSDPVIEKDI